jgi:putative colanic acid biosynthesis acetyltransferase WcaF
MLIQGNDPSRQPSFTVLHRARRLAWNATYSIFFRLSPRPLHGWRVFLLRLFGAHLGEGCHIYPGVRIWAPWNLYLGKYVGVADGAILYSMDRIDIGDYAVISQGAHLCGGTHDYNSANFQLVTKPVFIGAHTWVCADVFIHPGVSIAEGVVVGARSVVNKSLMEPWTVCSGYPCEKVAVRSRKAKRSEWVQPLNPDK